jgi:hypothetical protein
MKQQFLIRAPLCLAPLVAAFLLPPAFSLWVESRRFTLPLAAAFSAVGDNYSRPFGDSLWVTTFYQFPPFVLLSVALAFFARRLSPARLAALCFSGLALISFVQVRLTIPILKAIPEGEAEFIQFRYIFVSVVSALLLSLLWFLVPALQSRDFQPARRNEARID